jgi:predicted transcriptional regulator
MRTTVDLSDNQIRALDAIAKKEKQSRASLIRQAVHDYLDKRRMETDAFGLWADRKVDGLAYQEKVRRSEW